MDLHSGLPYWIAKNPLYDYYNPLRQDYSAPVVIIGSGITGALVAHELCSSGIKCCVVDKRTPSTGSSIASTALLQYEIDTPLHQLIDKVGEEHAVTAYRSCLESIDDIHKVLETTGTDAEFKKVSNVFYASNWRGSSLIKEEYKTRQQHNLPVDFLNRKKLFDQYGIKASCALTNNVSAQMDPFAAATGILHHHISKGDLELWTHTNICNWNEAGDGYELVTESGHRIQCGHVVVAAGFEAEPFLPKKVMQLTSTYAIISEPVDREQLWPEQSLIWETANPYLYIRTTAQNRIIVGGEDEPFKNPVARDSLLRKKIAKLEKKFHALFPHIPFRTDMAWCGTFSSTEDGLPFIGTWPGKDRMFYALGYGGNGITFSMIAAQVITNRLNGITDHREKVFGFERLLNQ